VMRSADADGFNDALRRAQAAYADPPRWRSIQAQGMARDFGWDKSAAQYVEVYAQAAARAGLSSRPGLSSGAGLSSRT
jgi:starch synthase